MIIPLLGSSHPNSKQPSTSYLLTIDKTDLSFFTVEMSIRDAGHDFQVAMAAHPEYDDQFWRYVEDIRVVGHTATISRQDSALWRIRSPAAEVIIRYRIHLPAKQDFRGAWRPFVSATGALVGGIHSFMYVVGAEMTAASVQLNVPQGWKIATGLVPTGDPNIFSAASVFSLIDSPILTGELKHWSFKVDNVPHHVWYWPSPNAASFDTTTLVVSIRKIVQQSAFLFGGLPYREYSFLLQDGSYGGLEHLNSVTLGIPSESLAKNINSFLVEIAHEYFHSWNLMRIHPDGYGGMSYTTPPLSNGLWFSEGLTMFYADLLLRRAGLPAEDLSRVAHLEELIKQYYGNKGNSTISPEKVSLAAYGPEGMLGDLSASIHLQGELIGILLDLIIRDATNGKRSLDDLMRLMMNRFSAAKGFTTRDVETTVAEICGCDLHDFFQNHVSGNTAFDLNKYLQLIGLRSTINWKEAAGEDGKPYADTRIYPWQASKENTTRIAIMDPESCWGKTGLHTGDIIRSINGRAIKSRDDFWVFIRTVRIGDTVHVELQRPDRISVTNVFVTGYLAPQVNVSEMPSVNGKQKKLKQQWLSGN